MTGSNGSTPTPDTDIVVVGAGFAGLYMAYTARQAGLSLIGLEAADDIGGTWYWNRYPGARCDIQSLDYSYSFDPDLSSEWEWSEKYATQPEILAYMRFVADKHDLTRDFRFSTRVDRAEWDDESRLWTVYVEGGEAIRCRWYVMATGCLSMPKTPDIPGYGSFSGGEYYTGRWPHEGVDFSGKRVAVIGTGSSAIQSIPIIAREAAHTTVFQRTPNFTFPAHNGPIPEEKRAKIEGREAEYREEARWSRGGVPTEMATDTTFSVSEEERLRRWEEVWEAGELWAIFGAFADQAIDMKANDAFAEFVRGKVRSIVEDPELAEKLAPRGYPVGTKRPCLDTDYYETFNLPNVDLVDLRDDPIVTITESGIRTENQEFAFDDIVYATGFDAMTGALVGVDIRGRDGVTLAQRWADGPTTYLGLTAVDFPNLFMVTGPQSPSVLSNMIVSIEQHIDWITDTITDLRDSGYDAIEPTITAEQGWVQHTADCGDITLMSKANSWYLGANVPGKPRVFLPYIGGVGEYRRICNEIREKDYLGFTRRGPAGTTTTDGVVRELQPDVAMMVDMMMQADMPPLESLPVEMVRQAMAATAAKGPEVGEVVEGALPGPESELPYRLYRPDTEGPHPLVAYFHGGGWTIGDLETDDGFCRDLCLQADVVVVSVNYRHAPEHRFPAAHDDAFAAVQWLAEHAEELGALPDSLSVAGWSAGANLATWTCHQARAEGGPTIRGQLLVCPVADSDLSSQSYSENGEGLGLTAAVMQWFFDHYVDPEDRGDPRVAPLRADDLSGLPPAAIFTAQFDPLRDEGNAYAAALAEAGVPVEHTECRGQIHLSLLAVGQMISSAEHRAAMARAVKGFTPVRVG